MARSINNCRILQIKQGGFYYSVSGNDALILNKYLGYKLYGKKQYRTGFPVAGQKSVLEKIDALEIDYDLIDQTGNLLFSKRFENNKYEIIDFESSLVEVKANLEGSQKNNKLKKKPFKERLVQYVEILKGLTEGVDVFTGQVVEGLDEELKHCLFEMSLYFDRKLKGKEELGDNYPNHGKMWLEDEDKQLLEEYNQGKTVKELSLIFLRGEGAIRSRLIKLGIIL